MPDGSANDPNGSDDKVLNTPAEPEDNSGMKSGETAKLSAMGKENESMLAAAADLDKGSTSASSSQWSAPSAGATGSTSVRRDLNEAGAGTSEQGNPAMSETANHLRSAASSTLAAMSAGAQDALSGAGDEIKTRGDEGADQMRETASEGLSDLSDVADRAKTAASSMAAAASDTAQRVASEVSDEFERMIEERKREGAQQLHRLADAVDRASSELAEEFPLLARYGKRGASRIDTFAETIEERDGRALAAEAGDLVRRRAGTMAGVLGLVGFAAVRFLKATPRHAGTGGNGQEGSSDVRGTDEAVQRALRRSAAPGGGTGSGDPGGISPVAPGFETASGASGATRGIS